MNIVALICARGGSKGVPGKNIRLLGGRPLITWAISQARSVERVGRVIVSTDSTEIAAVALAAGAEVPFIRPAELAEDRSPEWLVWRHALAHIKATDGHMPDALLVVPATAPLRLTGDLDRCLDSFAMGQVDTVITVTDAHRNPYFNMVQTRPDGYAALVIPPKRTVARRQDAPVVYDMTTVAYVTRPAFVMKREGVFAGHVRAVYVPSERALDIDTPLDFQLAELLLSRDNPAAEGQR